MQLIDASRKKHDVSCDARRETDTFGYVLGNPLKYSDPKGTLNPAQSVYEGCVLGVLVGLGYLTSKTIEAVCGDDGSDCLSSSSNNNSDGDESPLFQGSPGGRINSNDGNGRPKQDRIYGDDGYPEKDIDYDHDHGSGSPHVHDGNGPGGRDPARPPESGEAR